MRKGKRAFSYRRGERIFYGPLIKIKSKSLENEERQKSLLLQKRRKDILRPLNKDSMQSAIVFRGWERPQDRYSVYRLWVKIDKVLKQAREHRSVYLQHALHLAGTGFSSHKFKRVLGGRNTLPLSHVIRRRGLYGNMCCKHKYTAQQYCQQHTQFFKQLYTC
ncbi:hypothetical protein SAMN05421739_101865 [Pontibacter chinhatensis]|uniref:Uncharacterized protein n=1 Tax=Pontibacter chinhatensis TaxID=1436961 RepID=A0A1I2NZ02_9BACT|nr:hypothetical protein SAMN05421739_101865 [Pontibacter chinhatensis]